MKILSVYQSCTKGAPPHDLVSVGVGESTCRLFEAAEDLLEACKATLKAYHEANDGVEFDKAFVDGPINLILKAIAKADGSDAAGGEEKNAD